MLRRQHRRDAGFSMAEIAFALLVLGVGLVSVVGFFPQGILIQKRAQDRTAAANGAQRIAARIQSGTNATENLEADKLVLFDDMAPSTGFGQQYLEMASGKYAVAIHYEKPGGQAQSFLTVRVFELDDVTKEDESLYTLTQIENRNTDDDRGNDIEPIEGFTTTLRVPPTDGYYED